jgi:hypothetical protein
MKKLAIILALLLVPMTAFGMDTISDSDLDAVTGQAGVSIALNSIQIQSSGGTTSYGDPDQDRWISITGSVTAVTTTIGFHSKYNPWLISALSGGPQTNLNFDTLTIDIDPSVNAIGERIILSGQIDLYWLIKRCRAFERNIIQAQVSRCTISSVIITIVDCVNIHVKSDHIFRSE